MTMSYNSTVELWQYPTNVLWNCITVVL